MIRLMAFLVCMCSAIRAEAGVLPQLRGVPLSSFPTELNALDAVGVLKGVYVPVCGVERYDSFFFEVARIQGTVALADSLTSQFRVALMVAGAGDFEVPPSDPEQWPELIRKVEASAIVPPANRILLQECEQRLQMMIEPLVSIGGQLPGMIEQVPGLTYGAREDFTGFRGKIKLVGVLIALRTSAGQLHDAGANSKRTLENIQGIVAAMPH